ncbi:MAG: nitrilase-related carbon-nitrogen hydrolase, partial [Acidimicrobiia bacterium]
MDSVRIAGGQLNLRVGDIDGNVSRISVAMSRAEDAGADVLLLPELAIPGYPPEDLLLREQFVGDNLAALDTLAERSGEVATVLGFVDRLPGDGSGGGSAGRAIANAAAVLCGGRVVGIYHKVLLPNYGVFDEARYFTPGAGDPVLWDTAGVAAGVSVCEDIWSADGPPQDQARAGARILYNINGSPFHRGKSVERAALLSSVARGCGVPVVYLNLVGGQDELVFDGDSMVFDAGGELVYRAAQFEEELFIVDVEAATDRPTGGTLVTVTPPPRPRAPLPAAVSAERLDPIGEVYTALVTGLRDYVRKNGFREVVVGLSGGIDSALTCVIAVDALGPDAVWGVTMPARYSSQGSVDDSEDLAKRLGCRFDRVDVDDVFAAYLDALAAPFATTETGVAEEN